MDHHQPEQNLANQTKVLRVFSVQSRKKTLSIRGADHVPPDMVTRSVSDTWGRANSWFVGNPCQSSSSACARKNCSVGRTLMLRFQFVCSPPARCGIGAKHPEPVFIALPKQCVDCCIIQHGADVGHLWRPALGRMERPLNSPSCGIPPA